MKGCLPIGPVGPYIPHSPSISPVLPAGGVTADPGPDLSREGPFDARDADHVPLFNLNTFSKDAGNLSLKKSFTKSIACSSYCRRW